MNTGAMPSLCPGPEAVCTDSIALQELQQGAPAVLLGNILGAGENPTAVAGLAEALGRIGIPVTVGGRGRGRFRRVLDMFLAFRGAGRATPAAVMDLYSGRGFWAVDLLSRFAGFLQIPVVLVLHGGSLPMHGSKYPRAARRLLRRAARVVSPSPYLAEWSTSLGVEALVISNPIHRSRYPQLTPVYDSPRLYWVRRFHSIYDPETAVRAFAQVATKFPKAHLRMAGPDGGLRATCEALAVTLGVRDRIEFNGFLSKAEIVEHAEDRNVFLNTSVTDNTPVTVLEAAALGLPLVSTHVGGMPAMLGRGSRGRLVPPSDPKAMADAVGAVLSETQATHAKRKAAFEMADAADWDVVLPQWMEVIRAARPGVA